MTLMISTQSPVNVSAWTSVEDKLQLTVGPTTAFLSVEDVKKLRDYLDTFVRRFGEPEA